jgi:hypothetical protein
LIYPLYTMRSFSYRKLLTSGLDGTNDSNGFFSASGFFVQ